MNEREVATLLAAADRNILASQVEVGELLVVPPGWVVRVLLVEEHDDAVRFKTRLAKDVYGLGTYHLARHRDEIVERFIPCAEARPTAADSSQPNPAEGSNQEAVDGELPPERMREEFLARRQGTGQ